MLAGLARMLAPGGLLSLLVRNGDALAMRPGLLGDWAGALAAFGAPGTSTGSAWPTRADRLSADRDAGRVGAPLHAWYGVRVFTDAAPDHARRPRDPGELDAAPGRRGAGGPRRPLPRRWRRCCTCAPSAADRSARSRATTQRRGAGVTGSGHPALAGSPHGQTAPVFQGCRGCTPIGGCGRAGGRTESDNSGMSGKRPGSASPAQLIAAAVCAALLTTACTHRPAPPRAEPTPCGAEAAVGSAATTCRTQYQDTVRNVLPSVVQITTARELGSGVVYDDRGDIVTNAHVVGDATDLPGRWRPAAAAARASWWRLPPDDLAVIRLDSAPAG